MQQAGEGGPGEAGQEEVEVGGRAGLAEEPAEERAAGGEGRAVGGVTGDGVGKGRWQVGPVLCHPNEFQSSKTSLM